MTLVQEVRGVLRTSGEHLLPQSSPNALLPSLPVALQASESHPICTAYHGTAYDFLWAHCLLQIPKGGRAKGSLLLASCPFSSLFSIFLVDIFHVDIFCHLSLFGCWAYPCYLLLLILTASVPAPPDTCGGHADLLSFPRA